MIARELSRSIKSCWGAVCLRPHDLSGLLGCNLGGNVVKVWLKACGDGQNVQEFCKWNFAKVVAPMWHVKSQMLAHARNWDNKGLLKFAKSFRKIPAKSVPRNKQWTNHSGALQLYSPIHLEIQIKVKILRSSATWESLRLRHTKHGVRTEELFARIPFFTSSWRNKPTKPTQKFW